MNPIAQWILTYVPEADYLPYAQALELAIQRDNEAAEALLESILDEEEYAPQED